ncbi:MAG: hypothetical protein ACM31O_02640, partial [Bacteroidota bacterium]
TAVSCFFGFAPRYPLTRRFTPVACLGRDAPTSPPGEWCLRCQWRRRATMTSTAFMLITVVEQAIEPLLASLSPWGEGRGEGAFKRLGVKVRLT